MPRQTRKPASRKATKGSTSKVTKVPDLFEDFDQEVSYQSNAANISTNSVESSNSDTSLTRFEVAPHIGEPLTSDTASDGNRLSVEVAPSRDNP